MFNVCAKCGSYRVDKIIDPDGPYAICPECGHPHKFVYQPLWIVSGASGSGKSTVCNHLTGRIEQAVMLDSDILWQEAFDSPETSYRIYFETWLRMCKNITQSGRPVVLFGAGVGVPENLENCIERRYFSQIHYLALVCSDEALASRLKARPAWRASHLPAFIEEHQRFNQWFINYKNTGSQPPIRLLDTTILSMDETAREISAWINEILPISESS
jgi:predicted kinase